MITTEGRIHIKRVLAAWESYVGQSIAFGIGSEPTVVDDLRLQFETARAPVTLTSYDFTQDRLIFKGRLPEGFAGTVYEVGLYSGKVNGSGWQFGSRVVTTFDSSSEEWTVDGAPANYTIDGSRTGSDSLLLTAPSASSVSAVQENMFVDLSNGMASDVFSFAFNNTDAFADSVNVRFKNDQNNYFEFTVNPSGTGYEIVTLPRSAAAVNGNPLWDNIYSIEAVLNAVGGTASVSLDAIRIDGTLELSQNNILVAREVLAVPFTKTGGRVEEVEISIGVSI